MRKKEKGNTNCLVSCLFIIYMTLLVWIILFKLQFSIREIDASRSINLIPFHYDNEIGTAFHLKEVLQNVAIFIPFGIYLCMFKHKPNFKIKSILILAASSVLEISQYILAVGRTDITDIISNTCGGIIGIGLYWLIVKIFRDEKLANEIITVLAATVTVVVVGGLSVLLISN